MRGREGVLGACAEGVCLFGGWAGSSDAAPGALPAHPPLSGSPQRRQQHVLRGAEGTEGRSLPLMVSPQRPLPSFLPGDQTLVLRRGVYSGVSAISTNGAYSQVTVV